MDLGEARSTSTSARHPWETTRARFFADLVVSLRMPAPLHVLDVGAGDAFVARALVERVEGARVVAWDRAYTDADIAAATSERIEAVREAPRGPFDVALLLDVLEHVDDDERMLRDVAALVRPNGAIVVSVPAWPALFALHDIKLRHKRRYTPRSARALVKHAGLRVERSGGLFHSLLPPRALAVARESLTLTGAPDGVGAWDAGPTLTRAIEGALRVDTLVSRALARVHVEVPGLSWWCVARP